jgi:threonine/homoserine/homoserine lactone efflux protein
LRYLGSYTRNVKEGERMNSTLFVVAAVSLLVTPGPTNTLLATSGASAGLRRSAHLLVAELGGYLLAIALLRALLGPMIAATPMLGEVLRMAATIYLIYLAIVLWHQGDQQTYENAPVTFFRVFVTTLLNPKAIIFALTLLPSPIGFLGLLPWLFGLSALIVAVGTGWIIVGRSLGRGLSGIVSGDTGYRLSAVALALLAGVIGIQLLG